MSNGYASIPGRRITSGEVLYTDWINVTGACLLLRAECLMDGGGNTVTFTPQTRGDEGGTITDVSATSAALTLTAAGFATTAYLASTSTSPGNGLQKQVRIKIATSGVWTEATYMVVRLHAPIMFDSSKEY